VPGQRLTSVSPLRIESSLSYADKGHHYDGKDPNISPKGTQTVVRTHYPKFEGIQSSMNPSNSNKKLALNGNVVNSK